MHRPAGGLAERGVRRCADVEAVANSTQRTRERLPAYLKTVCDLYEHERGRHPGLRERQCHRFESMEWLP